MGKHYCDYCDVFLTHDSVSVRKAHNSGRNHLQNVREYYQSLDPDQIQQVLDTLAKEYDRRGIEKPRDLLQPAGSSFMTFGAGPLSGTSDRGEYTFKALTRKVFFSADAAFLTCFLKQRSDHKALNQCLWVEVEAVGALVAVAAVLPRSTVQQAMAKSALLSKRSN